MSAADRWRRIDELYQEALDRAPEERPGYLDRACEGDPQLAEEVRSLLDCNEQAEGFLDAPVLGPDFRMSSAAANEGPSPGKGDGGDAERAGGRGCHVGRRGRGQLRSGRGEEGAGVGGGDR